MVFPECFLHIGNERLFWLQASHIGLPRKNKEMVCRIAFVGTSNVGNGKTKDKHSAKE
jgi:hypothetical protein